MATIRIEFNTDNAAFEGDNYTHEVGRIMRRATDAIFHDGGKLLDANGNTVGKVEVEK